jgi:hypothetical protein
VLGVTLINKTKSEDIQAEKGIPNVRSHCKANYCENKAEWEDLKCAVNYL